MMRKMFLAAVAATMISAPSQAAITITIQELGGSLFETAIGSLDLTGLKAGTPGKSTASFSRISSGGTGLFDLNLFETDNVVGYRGIAFGQIARTSSNGLNYGLAVGDFFAFSSGTTANDRADSTVVSLSASYVSGMQIAASGQQSGATLASLGLVQGSYAFQTPKDVIYLNIGVSSSSLVTFSLNPTSSAPEPATWAMMIAGFGMVGATIRRRKIALSFA